MRTASRDPRDTHRPGHLAVHAGAFDLRIDTRVLTLAAIAIVVAVGIGILAMTLGSVQISPRAVFLAAIDRGSTQDEFVVRELRMPRVLVALMVGAALAISGAIFQGLVRNELASPDLIGINVGAAVVGLGWLLLTRNTGALPIVLFAGAMGMSALIYVLSWKHGILPTRLILVGIGLQSLLVAVETFLVSRFPADDVAWADNVLLGSLSAASWANVRLLGIGLLVLLPIVALLAWPLRAMQLGDDVARSVGWPIELVRFGLIAIACWLSALSIAVVGLIGFVALIVPHAARTIAGPVSASVLLLTGVLGGLFLLVGDVVTQHLLPVPLPITVVLGAVGAPYFLVLFWRKGTRI